jgi:hypothetical protein
MMKRKEALGNGREADRLALPIWAQALGVFGVRKQVKDSPLGRLLVLFFLFQFVPFGWDVHLPLSGHPGRWPFDSVVPLLASETLAGSTSLALDVTWPTG